MCQVFHDVEFRVVGYRLLGSVDGDHAVLGPAPGAAPARWLKITVFVKAVIAVSRCREYR